MIVSRASETLGAVGVILDQSSPVKKEVCKKLKVSDVGREDLLIVLYFVAQFHGVEAGAE